MRRGIRRHGHTLGELMASLTVVGALLAALGTFVAGTAGSALDTRGYAEDLRTVRVGVDRVTALVRTADRVRMTADGVQLAHGDVTRTLHSADGVVRLGDDMVVRGIGSLRVEPQEAGVLIVAAPPSRSDRPAPEIRRLVVPRTEGTR